MYLVRTGRVLVVVAFAHLLAACGDDGGGAPVDACTPGAVTAEVTSPATYACMEPFHAAVSVTNGTCASITVRSIMIGAQVTAGVCGASGPGSYQPSTATVPAGATVEVLDLTTAPFCCGAPGCPATLECSETFTFTVDTTAGVVTDSVSSDLDLGGCSTVCP
jgi:hypothetical protein